jgi:hypothetical protein
MKKQSIDYSLIAAAHHEAAHTIIALLNLIQVSDVSVRIDEADATGLTQFYMYKNSHTDDKELSNILIFADLQVAYSGLTGERIYYKDICGSSKFPLHLRIGSSEDFASAQKLIRTNNLAAPGPETSALKKKLQSEVESMLIAYWDDVKLVAHALYQRRKLYYVDLKNLLTRKNDRKDFWKMQFKLINFIHHDSKIPEEQEVKEALHKNATTIIR